MKTAHAKPKELGGGILILELRVNGELIDYIEWNPKNHRGYYLSQPPQAIAVVGDRIVDHGPLRYCKQKKREAIEIEYLRGHPWQYKSVDVKIHCCPNILRFGGKRIITFDYYLFAPHRRRWWWVKNREEKYDHALIDQYNKSYILSAAFREDEIERLENQSRRLKLKPVKIRHFRGLRAAKNPYFGGEDIQTLELTTP